MLNVKNPQIAMSIQPTPKANSAKKLRFMNTKESSLVQQYLDNTTLKPRHEEAMNESMTITGVAPTAPCPSVMIITPPKLMNTPSV